MANDNNTHDNTETLEPTAPENETKEEKFIRLATHRTTTALKRIRLLRNLANTSQYSFTDAQVNHIFAALRKELDETEAAFQRETSQDPMFSFGSSTLVE